MELRQLQYLVAVADEGGFTRAARRLYVTQSGISAQIRRLERELGVTLFDRGARVATPTAAGAVAIDHARRVLAEVRALGRAIVEVGDLVQGRLDLGVVTAFGSGALVEALAEYHRAHPDVAIELVEGQSAALVDRVREADLDVALVGVAEAPPAGLESRVLVRDRLVVGVTRDHPLARSTHLTMAEVCAHPIVCLPVGNGIRVAFEMNCARAEVVADVRLEASAPDAIADLAARGLGVAVLSESSIGESRADGLVSVLIEDAPVHALLALVWRPEPVPAVRRWLEIAGDLGFERPRT
ncbi:LysR family transcriptional regulator [Williamsia sp. M5A3_1d]